MVLRYTADGDRASICATVLRYTADGDRASICATVLRYTADGDRASICATVLRYTVDGDRASICATVLRYTVDGDRASICATVLRYTVDGDRASICATVLRYTADGDIASICATVLRYTVFFSLASICATVLRYTADGDRASICATVLRYTADGDRASICATVLRYTADGDRASICATVLRYTADGDRASICATVLRYTADGDRASICATVLRYTADGDRASICATVLRYTADGDRASICATVLRYTADGDRASICATVLRYTADGDRASICATVLRYTADGDRASICATVLRYTADGDRASICATVLRYTADGDRASICATVLRYTADGDRASICATVLRYTADGDRASICATVLRYTADGDRASICATVLRYTADGDRASICATVLRYTADGDRASICATVLRYTADGDRASICATVLRYTADGDRASICATVLRYTADGDRASICATVLRYTADGDRASICATVLVWGRSVSGPERRLGECEAFLGLREDLESVYKEYCASYTNTLALESSYKQSEGLWQEIIQTIKTVAPHTNASSLSFFMVMPVQRIARYPLLLQNVLKNTEPSHPGYQRLQEAATATVELNIRINEYKRLKEVADKYKKMESLTIMDRLCRINKHSIAKKTARLSQMMKHEAGIVPKDFLRSRPHERDLDIENEEAVRCYKEISEAMHQWIYPTFRRRLEALVFRPLCMLRELMAGPRNLIRKRLHKLLDFEQIEEKRQSGSMSYEEQEVANTYQALNALLLSELPRLNATGTQLLLNTLGAFSCIQRDLAAEVERLSQWYLQQLPHSHLPPSAFWHWVGDAIQEGTQKVQSASQSIGEHLNTPIAMVKKHFLNKYCAGNIAFCLACTLGAFSCIQRDLAAEVERLSQWYLQQLPHSHLPPSAFWHWVGDAIQEGTQKVQSASQSIGEHLNTPIAMFPSSQYLSPVVGGAECRRHSYTEMTVTDRTTAPPCFQVLAGYDFSARGSHELSLQAGEPVKVLEPHDKRGSPEWSLVEARGQRGYAPSNYLMVVPMLGGHASAPSSPNLLTK
ncbi:UNVERIFIED_CONTAM: hypothetical protein FKN15_002278 [Acipenser sinensis]